MRRDLRKLTDDELANLCKDAESDMTLRIVTLQQNYADIVANANYQIAEQAADAYHNLSNIYEQVRVERERRALRCFARQFNSWENPNG